MKNKTNNVYLALALALPPPIYPDACIGVGAKGTCVPGAETSPF